VNIYRAITRWIPLALWIAFIFVMSSIPDLPGEYRDLPTHSDKVVHFIEYFILAILLYRGLGNDGTGRMNMLLITLILIGVGIAGLDELYQSIVPRRDSSIADLASDIGGIAAGALVVFSRWKLSLSKD
jgi:VanZ family protein